jgi:hypothetical protein
MNEAWDTNLKREAERLVMESKTVRISVKNVFGRVLYYPENQTARNFAELLSIGKSQGQKAFTEEHLKLIRALGFTVEAKPTELHLG